MCQLRNGCIVEQHRTSVTVSCVNNSTTVFCSGQDDSTFNVSVQTEGDRQNITLLGGGLKPNSNYDCTITTIGELSMADFSVERRSEMPNMSTM